MERGDQLVITKLNLGQIELGRKNLNQEHITFIQGRSQGGSWGARDSPLLQAFFKQAIYNRAMTISWP